VRGGSGVSPALVRYSRTSWNLKWAKENGGGGVEGHEPGVGVSSPESFPFSHFLIVNKISLLLSLCSSGKPRNPDPTPTLARS
jgi:hypothetical protein